jgi:pilus assembly protein CpaC
MKMTGSAFIRILAVSVIMLSSELSSSALSAPRASHEVLVPKVNAGPQSVRLFLNRSLVVKLPVAMKRMSIANPDVADTIILNPKELYLTGKKCGATNVVIWGPDKQIVAVLDLDVSIDIGRLRERLNELFSNGRITAVADGDTITLSGSVEDQETMTKVLSLAESYAPKRVNNFLAIGRVQRGLSDGDSLANVEMIRGVAVETVTTREGK